VSIKYCRVGIVSIVRIVSIQNVYCEYCEYCRVSIVSIEYTGWRLQYVLQTVGEHCTG